MTIDAGSVEVRIEGDVSPLRHSVEEGVEELGKLEKAARRLDEAFGNDFGTKALEKFDEASSKAGDSFASFVDGAVESTHSFQGLGQAIKGLGLSALTVGLTSATGALVNLAKKGIQATDFLETSRIAMAGLTGSMAEGNKAMTEAAKFWQANPFQRVDVTNATKQLVQFGRTTKDIPNDLETLGNVSLSTGMNIADLARYYARVSASGRAMTMDLEMMSDRGVPIYRELEKQLKTTTAGVREMASQGKIDFETFRKAMEGAVSAEAMEEYENTLARQVDRFKGSIQILAGDLAGYKIINDELVISENGLEKAWTRLLKTLATGLRSEKMRAGLEKLGEALAKIVDKITTLVEPALNILSKAIDFIGENSELILPLLGGLSLALGNIATQIPGIGTVVSKLMGPLNGVLDIVGNLIKTKPGLSAVIGIFGVGLIEAFKNNERFRDSIKSIFQSLKTIFENVMTAVRAFIDVIMTLANSDAVQGIIEGIAQALAWVAQALASIPPEMITTLISFFVSLRLLKANPLYLLAVGITLIIGKIKELGGIGKVLEKVPETLATIGHNMMTGLVNGIQEGAKKVFEFIKQLGQTIISSLKNILGIHSPSTVMYGIGQNVALGLANGIEDGKSAVQLAMNNLAKDILSISEKVIRDKVDFGILDIKQEYQQWKKVSKLFTVGSEQYNTAVEKMEDARKRANLQILSLQQSYNNALDETISRIANMYGLLDDVNVKAGKNSNQILQGLDQQVARLTEWAEAQEIISKSGLDAGLVEELQNMGVDATSELSAIANMTADELSTLNNMWLKKQEIANKTGVKQMEGLKKDTLNQINDLKNGIDGVTVDVADVGGRLVENISEGVYGAMPTLESAFAQLGDYIAKAQRELAKNAANSTAGVGTETPDAGDEIAKTLKNEIENGLDKVKDMLPNILLGAIGAWGVFKFGPKILKAIARKLSGGSLFQQGLAGILMPDTGVGLTKESFSQLLGQIDVKRDGGFLSKAIGEIQKVLSGETSELVDGATDAAKNMKKVAEPAKTIADNATVLGDGVETTGKSLSKADSFLNTIMKGAGAVIMIAGAIAAMAGALWLTYNALKDVDFAVLTGQLAMMAGTIGVFGWLSETLGEAPLSTILKGILEVIGIAAEIALLSLALRVAYEAMKPIDWEGFGKILGMMAATIGTFGLLNGIMGIKPIAIAEGLGLLVSAGIIVEIVLLSKAIREAYETMLPIEWEGFGKMIGMMAEALGMMGALNAPLGALILLEGLGWASVMMICDELTKVAKALVVVDLAVPEDFTSLEKKLQNIKRTLEIINGLDLGTVIGMMVTSWSAGPVERIMGMYVTVAEQLNKLSHIDLDQKRINENLDYIKATLETIKAKTDIISGWLEASALDAEASTVENAGRIVIVYGNMVDALNKLANFKPEDDKISKALTAMAGVISLLREQSYGDGGIFKIFNSMDTVANDVERIKSIVSNYIEMVPNIKTLGEEDKQISDELYEKVRKNCINIKNIVTEIGSVRPGHDIEQKEKDIQKIQSIINKFTELDPVIYQFSKADIAHYIGDNEKGAKGNIRKMKELVLAIGSVDTGGWIDQKESDVEKIRSILHKFTEMEPVMYQLSLANLNYYDRAKGIIQKVRDLVWEIGQVNTSESANMDAKIDVVEKSKTLVGKLKEFNGLLEPFQGGDKGEVITALVGGLNQLLDGVSNSMNEKVASFSNIGVTLGQSITDGINQQKPLVANAGAELQGSFWSGIDGKMNDEFEQGKALANKFGEGLKSVSFENIGADIQSSLWHAINNRMQDEYYQGRSMGEKFRQGLYDIDYANAGWWAVQGFINGVVNRGFNSGGDNVYNVGRWIAESFLKGLKDRGEQGSPWKTTIESGNWAVEGLIEGIREQEGALVSEATSLADQVVEALTMDDLTMTPSLDATVNGVAPNMSSSDYGIVGADGRNVAVQQVNNVYTEYDLEQVQRDLAYSLSKV